jgi:hypothetical protein
MKGQRRAPQGPTGRWATAAHVQAVIGYCLLFGICVALRPIAGDDVSLAAQSVAGLVALLALWRRLDWHGEGYVSFGGILLLAAVANRVLYAVDIVLNGNRLFAWPFPSENEWGAVAKGEWMTVVGTIIVVYFWRRAGGLVAATRSTASSPGGRGNVGYWVLYVCAVAIELLRQRGILSDAIAQLAAITYASGLGAIVILNDRRGPRAVIAIRTALMTLPLAFLALGSGMKEAVIVSFLPLMIVYWRRLDHIVTRVALMVGMALAAALITSFVSSYRDRVWVGDEQVSSWTVLSDMFSDGPYGGTQLAEHGVGDFVMRSNATYHRGWAVDMADQDGYLPGPIFGELAVIFIPRFLWPEKPDIEPGQEHSARLYGDEYRLSSTSSTAAGLFPALYLGGGWIAFIVASIVLGWALGRLHTGLVRFGNPFSLSAFSWILLLYALRLDETWPIYALSGPLISFVYVIIVGSVVLAFARLVEPRATALAKRPGSEGRDMGARMLR